ncbi:MAG TPA: hypothetical protein PKI11_12625 [Candidatus Hydrogenedentes bacterium]|nr:hypothetical protein [Candidatus Hydrogenedentota bacterium]
MRSAKHAGWTILFLTAILIPGACSKEQQAKPEAQPADSAPTAAAPSATGWTVHDILAMAPEDAVLAAVAPSIDATFGQFERYLATEPVAQLAGTAGFSAESVLSMIGASLGLGDVSALSDILDKTGLDGARPIGIAISPMGESQGLAVLPIASADRFIESLDFAESTPVEVAVGNVVCTGAYDNANVAYILYKDYAIVGDAPAALERAARAIVEPGTVHYGTPDFPAVGREFVVRINTATLQNVFDTPLLPSQVDLAGPVLRPLAAICDEMILATEIGEDAMRMRIAAHGVASQEALPGALELPARLPADALGVLALRLSPGLRAYIKEAVAASAMAAGEAQIIQGMINTADGVLGEEVAAALLGVDMRTGPEAVVIAQSPSPKMIEGLLEMTGVGTAEDKYKGSQLYAAEYIPGLDFGLFWASTETHFILATDEALLRDAIDRLTAEAPPGGFALDAQRLAAANHGFLWLNGDKIMQVVAENMPDSLAVPAVSGVGQVTLTLEQHATWVQAVLESPKLAPATTALLPALTRARAEARRSSSQNNLKQWGIVFKMFANESKGQRFPALSPVPGNLMARGSLIYPEYVFDLAILSNPGAGEAPVIEISSPEDADRLIDDQGYVYLSHAVTNEEEGLAWIAAYFQAVEDGTGFDRDFETPDGKTIYRLREGIDRFFITDINDPRSAAKVQATMPVMWERPGVWDVDGINVLYFDGHVEFVRKGTFPYTETFMEALLALNALKNG